MSLVGVDVAFAGELPVRDADPVDIDDDDDDDHPSVTPLGAAELLFMGDINTQTVSAAALAQQIHVSRGKSSSSGFSIATDDFATAVGSFASALLSPMPTLSGSQDSSSPFSPMSDCEKTMGSPAFFRHDILTHQTSSFAEQDEDFQDSNMTTTTPKKIFPTEAPQHLDAAEKVYDTVKNVWGWGKGVGIINPFLGIAEGVAGHVAGMSGNTLEAVDGLVMDKLHGLDDNVLNPAIATVVGILLNVAGKSEDALKPLIITLLKPLGLIKDTAENPELTTIPGVTVTVQ